MHNWQKVIICCFWFLTSSVNYHTIRMPSCERFFRWGETIQNWRRNTAWGGRLRKHLDLCRFCHASRHGFCFGGKGRKMETRIAAISIIVEDPDSVEALNNLLHEYSAWILGRMGIPYREKKVSIICLAMDAPADIINAMTGRIGRLNGISAKAVYSRTVSVPNKE